ncbi:hypothetical protein SAY87_025487 [Trapa incisa]|uniref:Phospholipid:diacylglycerol acyltransferase 2 n=1 Tax=Trapa incisa TaxID=236973 RepID=A0AAN7GQU0_9MYRT|nr:hypothetical protein SAY87_025487 [Trapa incisa]
MPQPSSGSSAMWSPSRGALTSWVSAFSRSRPRARRATSTRLSEREGCSQGNGGALTRAAGRSVASSLRGVTGSLELWEGKPCTEGLFRKRLWGGGFTEIFKRPLCWLEHLSLDNETGLDPPGIRVRAVPGLVAADYYSPGYFVWAVLIQNLARIGYEEKNLHMAAYDWRLSFQNTEVRDHALSTLKSQIELMYSTNGNKRVVVVPHSMGVLYFLHFLKWVEMPPPLGSGGDPTLCSKHIKAVMNIAPAFLGVPKAMTNIISNEGKDIAAIRHSLQVTQEGFSCGLGKRRNLHSPMTIDSKNTTEGKVIFTEEEHPKYGRMIAFGKSAAHLPSSILAILNAKELSYGAALGKLNPSRQEAWTEHDEISRESTTVVVGNNKAYNSRTIFDLLRVLAPEMMKRGEAHFSHGIADNLDDPKYYSSYKYWKRGINARSFEAPTIQVMFFTS